MGTGELSAGFEPLSDGLVGCLAVKHALAAGVVGGVKAAEQVVISPLMLSLLCAPPLPTNSYTAM